MWLYNIILKPIITEKSSIQELNNSTYIAKIAPSATKIDVKKAIFEIYWVEVASVRIVNTIPKVKMSRKWLAVKRKAFKKAYITLKDSNSKIDFSIVK